MLTRGWTAKTQKRVLWLSLALNGALAATLVFSEPLAKVSRRIDDMAEYRQVTERFEERGSPAHPIVFVGDSLTADAPFCERVAGVLNRGIHGDDVAGVKSRIEEVVARAPAQVWLMIGTNDLKRRADPSVVADTIESLVDEILAGSPQTEVFVQSILPTRPRTRGAAQNEAVVQLNDKLARLRDRKGVHFVDIASKFRGDDGRIKEELTVDGVHLNAQGYQTWFEVIEPLLGRAPGVTTNADCAQ